MKASVFLLWGGREGGEALGADVWMKRQAAVQDRASDRPMRT